MGYAGLDILAIGGGKGNHLESIPWYGVYVINEPLEAVCYPGRPPGGTFWSESVLAIDQDRNFMAAVGAYERPPLVFRERVLSHTTTLCLKTYT